MTAITRTVDNALYTRRALHEAREAFNKYCVIRATPGTNGMADITVSVNREFEQDARQIVLEFWNFFLDTACQQRFDAA